MAERHRIQCVNKTSRYDPHDRIHSVGGVANDGTGWKIPQETAIQGIESGQWAFYVHSGGYEVNVIVANHLGRKYLKTQNDGVQPDNLLALPECPA